LLSSRRSCLALFSYSLPHPLYLRSFPTRRSSDLMVWQTDLSQINQALRELQRLNAELEEEQDLLAQETRVQSDEASIQARNGIRSEEHTSELQSRFDLVCRLLLEKKKKIKVK